MSSFYAVEETQRDAWVAEITLLRQVLVGREGWLFLEFVVPRLGSRIDAVLLLGSSIVVIEFKVGERQFNKAAFEQVWDYALDLKNFHRGSSAAAIVPVLIATQALDRNASLCEARADGVHDPVCCAPSELGLMLSVVSARYGEGEPLGEAWGRAPYWPTPTIIEAAQALYAKHSVEEISRHGAGAKNLAITSHRVESLIDQARTRQEKIIVFVTGVPGAGKTLVGLNVATQRRQTDASATHSVFLSGNGPLVAVLREALTRDEVSRRKCRGVRATKKEVGQPIKAFIQNVHHFRDDGLRNSEAPADHVVIFDEAQRAWNLAQTAKFMRSKKGRADFNQSEPEFLISYMDRHPDWAVVICLVGGGQEINTGEAGIAAWLDAVRDRFPHWHAYISNELTDSEYAAGNALTRLGLGPARVQFDDALHLSVSMRSFKAEGLSLFVKTLLDCDAVRASGLLAQFRGRYPLAVTRDLRKAKEWIRQHSRGTERYGLVASSAAHRLKPHAIDVRVAIDPVHWFLNDTQDPRSSYYLEDAATEFQVQGLELDWACVTWDADFRHLGDDKWGCFSFRGDIWQNVNKAERRAYLKNAYRVLLTRARQGMVIFVPEGDSGDHTRDPSYYDGTFRYLLSLGLKVL